MRTSPSSPPSPSFAAPTRIRRHLHRHRRALAAGLAALAFVLVVRDARPAPPSTVAVVVASREIGAGGVVTPDDVRVARIPSTSVPDGALREPPLGRVVALPVRGGEVLTDVRLLGPGLLDGLDGTRVAAPVRLADAAASTAVRAGDTVDVLAAGERGGSTVASGAIVVVSPPARATSAFASEGNGGEGVVVLAVTAGEAVALAGAAATQRLSVVLRPSPRS